MPFIRDSSSSSSSDVESNNNLAFGAQHMVDDANYAGASFPGSSEKPLSEQLEPIAVIGMGNTRPLLLHTSTSTVTHV